MQRPLGVTIVAALAIAYGVLNILAGGLALGISGIISMPQVQAAVSDAAVGMQAVSQTLIVGLLTILSGTLSLIFGLGAMTLKSWAWLAGLVIEGLILSGGVINLATASQFSFSSLVPILLGAAILIYLLLPGVRAVFVR